VVSAIRLAELLLASLFVLGILISTERTSLTALNSEVEALHRTARSRDGSAQRWLLWSCGIKLIFIRVIQLLLFCTTALMLYICCNPEMLQLLELVYSQNIGIEEY